MFWRSSGRTPSCTRRRRARGPACCRTRATAMPATENRMTEPRPSDREPLQKLCAELSEERRTRNARARVYIVAGRVFTRTWRHDRRMQEDDGRAANGHKAVSTSLGTSTNSTTCHRGSPTTDGRSSAAPQPSAYSHTRCRACCRVCGGNVGSALPFFVAYRLTLSDYRSFAITRADHGAFVEDAFAELPFLNPSHILFIILRPIHINFRTSIMVPCL